MPLLTQSQLAQVEALQQEGAKLILGTTGRMAAGAACVADAALLSVSTKTVALAGLLVCKGMARAQSSDPLRVAAGKRLCSWAKTGHTAIAGAGFGD